MANVVKIPNRTTFGLSMPSVKVFGSSGYYTPAKDCVVRIHLLGGGGGGANGGYGPQYYGAGGGYVQKTLRLKGGVSYNVTIGAGGSGGAETSNYPYSPFATLHGSAGGNTSFTNWDIDPLIAFGGAGSSNTPVSPSQPNAVGGYGVGGDVIIQGGSGVNLGIPALGGKISSTFLSPSIYTGAVIGRQDPFTGTGIGYATPASVYGSGVRGGFGGGGSGGYPQTTAPYAPSITFKFGGGPGGVGLCIIEEI